MKSEINRITLNGNTTSQAELKNVFSALYDTAILAEKGGYIFKSLIKEDHLYLGILPYFINGQRALHHDIELPEDPFTLIGFINSNSSLGLIFKISKEKLDQGLSHEEVHSYREQYIRIARFFLEYNFPKDFEIDIMTQQVLIDLKILPVVPANLGELAENSL